MTRSARSSSPGLPGTLPRLALVAAALTAPAAAQYTSFADRMNTGVDDVEITPDGRYAVARTTNAATRTFIVDLRDGSVVYDVSASVQNLGEGPCNDAVAVTDRRAITLGSQVQVIDLTTSPPSQIAEIDCGFRPRDVEITPDGTLAVVRGGGTFSLVNGTFVIDLGTGAVLLNHPSDPPGINAELGNDMVAVSADHAVSLAYDPNSETTPFIVLELDPMAGGGPRVVLDALGPLALDGRPMDVAISPDGLHAIVRGENEAAFVRLDGTNTQIVRRFSNFPGPTIPYLETAFDTVLITDQFWATITLGDVSTAAGYLDVEDVAGNHWFALLNGSPRDLAVTPDGNTLLVHTGRRIYEFDLASLPMGGGALSTVNSRQFLATHSGIRAGLDSVVCTDELAAVIVPDGARTRLRLYDLTGGPAPQGIFTDDFAGWPIDVDFTPDGAYVVVASWNRYIVVDTRTLERRIFVNSMQNGWYPWCDGVATHPDHAAAFGIGDPNAFGWLDAIDLVSRESALCASLANSTGEVGDLFALGSTRVGENDLELHARFLPAASAGLFVLADGSQQTPLGGGILCLNGNLIRLGVQITTPDGTAEEIVDYAQIPTVGGGIVAGSTWYAQFVHRDLPTAGGFNFTNGSALLFE